MVKKIEKAQQKIGSHMDQKTSVLDSTDKWLWVELDLLKIYILPLNLIDDVGLFA